jgi:hypothetical protein
VCGEENVPRIFSIEMADEFVEDAPEGEDFDPY